MRKIEFTDDQKSGIIYLLKVRNKKVTETVPNWSKTPKNWRDIYYYPTLTARLKLEMKYSEKFTQNEINMISSCINELATTEKYIDKIEIERDSIKEPFLTALKKLKSK